MMFSIEGLPEYRLTGFYGEPKRSLRWQTWGIIQRLAVVSSISWCIIGDLNNVLYHSDKKGVNHTQIG